jgi:hypothetical protein
MSRSSSRNNFTDMKDSNVFYRHDSKVDFGWINSHAGGLERSNSLVESHYGKESSQLDRIRS